MHIRYRSEQWYRVACGLSKAQSPTLGKHPPLLLLGNKLLWQLSPQLLARLLQRKSADMHFGDESFEQYRFVQAVLLTLEVFWVTSPAGNVSALLQGGKHREESKSSVALQFQSITAGRKEPIKGESNSFQERTIGVLYLHVIDKMEALALENCNYLILAFILTTVDNTIRTMYNAVQKEWAAYKLQKFHLTSNAHACACIYANCGQ
ncbi:hypothetical protein C0J52_18244 [Blattella germanica]|nr:hypothetical protein C0J52_18244 [Blattella germanica]